MEPCFSADYPDQHGECEIGMKQWITRRNSRVVAALRWGPTSVRNCRVALETGQCSQRPIHRLALIL